MIEEEKEQEAKVNDKYEGDHIEQKEKPDFLPCYRIECIFLVKKYYCDGCVIISDELVSENVDALDEDNENDS